MKKFLKKPRHTLREPILNVALYFAPKTIFLLKGKGIMIPFESAVQIDKPEGHSMSFSFAYSGSDIQFEFARAPLIAFIKDAEYEVIHFEEVSFPCYLIDISSLVHIIESDDLDPNALSEELEEAVANGKLRLAAELKKKIEELKNAAS